MKEIRAIIAVVVLLVGGFLLFKTLPAMWGEFKLTQLLEEQAVFYTYNNKSDQEIASAISKKAAAHGVALTPEQVTVQRTNAGLTLTANYSVHVDLPGYPLDLNFKPSSNNKNVMH